MDSGTMHLTDEEIEMLRGVRGEAGNEAVAYQRAVGMFFMTVDWSFYGV